MKAIYINLDPYLQAFADWLAAGKPGTAPKFDPLPLAVTIPFGETAAIYLPTAGTSEGTQEGNSVTIDGVDLIFGVSYVPWESVIASEVVPGLSSLAPSAKYAVAPFAGGDVSVAIYDEDGNEYDITFPVLVRRETASGPVDLVDFTPPLSLAGVSFAGVDIAGAEFDGNEIVADADTGALSAPAGA